MKPSSRAAALVLLSTVVACVGEVPPPPHLSVTSPERGLVQSTAGQVVVKGTALPGPDGSPITKVMVNETTAMLGADGSFTAVVQVPAGALLLETVAYSGEGGEAIDARAVHVGELRPVGSRIDRAVGASLSADAFVRISKAASEMLNSVDLSGVIAPVILGDSLGNLKVTIKELSIGDATVALTPVANGLQIHVEIAGLTLSATAAYAGTLVPDGSTTVSVTADKITVDGTLVVTPDGMGFKTTIASPNVATTALKLQASGLIGSVLDLMNRHLSSTVQRVITRGSEAAIQPGINAALGALGGPQRIEVLGKTLELAGSANQIVFTPSGAFASLNLAAKIAGSESSPGYIFTPNGTPAMDPGRGVELALSDDLMNDMLAQVHALHLLDFHLEEDFGLFDVVDIKSTLPPMISANTGDGKVRLVLGDVIATVTNKGKTLVRAAINAQVDISIGKGSNASEIVLDFGTVHVVANLLDDPTNPSEITSADLTGAANAGVRLQLDSLSEVLVTVPVPSIAGLTLDNLSLRGDSGYIVAGGEIH